MTYQKAEPGNLLHKLQNILASEFRKRFCYIQTFFKVFFPVFWQIVLNLGVRLAMQSFSKTDDPYVESLKGNGKSWTTEKNKVKLNRRPSMITPLLK